MRQALGQAEEIPPLLSQTNEASELIVVIMLLTLHPAKNLATRTDSEWYFKGAKIRARKWKA